MTSNDLLTYDGVTQPITEWALDYGIPAELIIDRINAGLSVEDAITAPMEVAPGQRLPDQQPKKNVTYTHDGQTLTLGEWARCAGIKYGTLRYRVNGAGMSIGDAINMAKHAKPGSASRVDPKPLPNGFAITIGTVRIEITDLGRGVVSNLKAFEGTGAGSAAQDRPEIDFSQDAQ